ncbi:hypothetical protein DM860_008309 [Cuscuta australis]|uniref:DOG1 domain-containing protein n=1 Tax=Cuscuta australis TaxID=267555 RepID=A0A328D743_9ASTE|nr:hypothetical protein DM860_008309 [Cuscuta australis]
MRHISSDMYNYCNPLFYLRGNNNSNDDNNDIEEVSHFTPSFHHHEVEDSLHLCTSSVYNGMTQSNVSLVSPNSLHHFGEINTSIGSSETAVVAEGGRFTVQGGGAAVVDSGLGNVNNFENWGDSATAEHSHQTDTSTDVDTDEKVQSFCIPHGAAVMGLDSIEKSKGRLLGEQKSLRRLAQNREAARKSRLRKKAYVQELENGRLRLAKLEHELNQARQQGTLATATGSVGDKSHSSVGNGALAFDMEYGSWLDEHQRLVADLRLAVNSFFGDNELRHIVDGVMSHYDKLFRIKRIGVKSDVFHVLSGMWKTPAERCFMWLGGFRSSEIIRILGSHLEPLTEQQLVGLCKLQQSSQQAEEALSQGMEALQQLLVETLSSASLGDYMDQMAVAMGKLATVENFLYQADLLRQQTLHQLHRILTTRQAARALLAMSDYMARLRALSSLWLARPTN